MTASASSPALEIAAIAAPGFAPAGARSLDLDRHLAERFTAGRTPEPPLEFGDGELDLIHSLFAFARLREEWPRWLAELHRLLAEGGLLIVAVPVVGGKAPPGLRGRDWLALRRREGDGVPSDSELAGSSSGLATLLDQLDSAAQGAVVGVRESFDRELTRKAFRIAELELGEEPTPAIWAFGERVAAEYEASLSWRVTRPLRAAKRLAGRR